jgi:isopentenyldiphosphate isomerase
MSWMKMEISRGGVVPKSEIYQHGLWHRHRMVAGWVVNQNGEILIQRRHPNKSVYPDTWDQSVGGHISAGESSINAVIRETQEELGLELTLDNFRLIGMMKQIEETGKKVLRNIFDVYLISGYYKIEDMKIQESEVAEIKYVSLDWLNQHTFDKDSQSIIGDEKYEILLKYLKN